MTKANILRHYKHFCRLASNKFVEGDFSQIYGDGGSMTMGLMSSQRRRLMQGDAIKNKEALEKKFPGLKEECEEPKEEIVKVEKETKSKSSTVKK